MRIRVVFKVLVESIFLSGGRAHDTCGCDVGVVEKCRGIYEEYELFVRGGLEVVYVLSQVTAAHGITYRDNTVLSTKKEPDGLRKLRNSLEKHGH